MLEARLSINDIRASGPGRPKPTVAGGGYYLNRNEPTPTRSLPLSGRHSRVRGRRDRTLDLAGELAEATGLQRLAPRWARSVKDSYIFFQSLARSTANAAR